MRVVAVQRSSRHTFSEYAVSQIEVVEGYGVAGDAHFGRTVKHRSRLAGDAGEPPPSYELELVFFVFDSPTGINI